MPYPKPGQARSNTRNHHCHLRFLAPFAAERAAHGATQEFRYGIVVLAALRGQAPERVVHGVERTVLEGNAMRILLREPHEADLRIAAGLPLPVQNDADEDRAREGEAGAPL